MAFGFPAYARGSRRYDSDLDTLRPAVPRALYSLGWRFYGRRSGRHYRAEVGVNLWSWGETIGVMIGRNGTVRVESRCALPTQCFDWGKNRSNVDGLLSMVARKNCRMTERFPQRDDSAPGAE